MSRSDYTICEAHSPQNLYDEQYYKGYHSACGLPYDRIEPWLNFFANIADKIVQEINPKTALDVGCAKGFLVEALRDRGVEAFGLDISEYAISQVRDNLKPYCWVASASDPFPQRHDLIVCIEVLEHLGKEAGKIAVANLCAYSDDVLFSSTPDDDGDATHINVQPIEYWAELFARQGFYRDLDFDATFIAKHAIRFRKAKDPSFSVVSAYERKLWMRLQELDAERLRNFELSGEKQVLEGRLLEAATQLSEAAQEKAGLREGIGHLQKHIGNLTGALQEIQSGLGWRLLSAYFGVRDRSLPPGSRRRAFYDAITKRLKPTFGGEHGSASRGDAANSSDIQLRPGGSRVLMVSGSGGDMERYRCYHAQEQFQLHGIHCDIRHLTDDALLHIVSDYDLVILHRVPYSEYVREIVQPARARKALVLFDMDDLVFDPKLVGGIDALKWMSQAEREAYEQGVRNYRRTLEMSDAALVTTDHLAEAVVRAGKPAWIHRNSLSIELIQISNDACRTRKRNTDKVVIGYASGTRTHNQDFLEVEAALERILQTYPQAELWIIGYLDLDERWSKWGARLKRIPFVPWRELPGLLAQFDINLAPLEKGNPFCEAKSELKYVEAAAVGVPTIASKLGAFKFAIRHGENGLLAENPEDSFSTLQELITNPTLRLEMGARARADALRRYHPQTRSEELLATLDRMAERIPGAVWKLALPLMGQKLPGDNGVKPVIMKEHVLAHALLDVLSGLEIGAAAYNPFGLRTRNVALAEGYDFYAEESRQKMHVEPAPVHIWASADDIPVPGRSEDFIITSHVVEHLPNVIAAFLEWDRIVKDDGYVFMIVPLKGALPEDEPRELTPLSHFVEDYEQKVTLDTHPTDGVPGGRVGHYHTFMPNSLLKVVYWMGEKRLCDWDLVALEDVDSKVGNGFTLVFKVTHKES